MSATNQQRARFGNSGDQFLASLVVDAKHLPDVVYLDTKYSDDEPRDDHGRWTTGGGGESSADLAPSGRRTDLSPEEVKTIVEDKLDALGMKDYPVKYTDEIKAGSEELTKASGFKGNTAAQFNPSTHGAGSFTFYTTVLSRMTTLDIKSVAEHEASHARLHYATRVPGSRIPTEKFLEQNVQALRTEDGNTAYSRAHWEVTNLAALKPPRTEEENRLYGARPSAYSKYSSGQVWDAVNESLAEMHAYGDLSKYPTYAKLDKMISARWGRRVVSKIALQAGHHV